jgi:hypothetical protein
MKDADLCCVNNNQKLRVKAPARPALRSSQCHDNIYADYGNKGSILLRRSASSVAIAENSLLFSLLAGNLCNAIDV